MDSAGVELVQDHLVLAGVHVGLGEQREQALVLPLDVVVAAARVVEVLDAVEVAVPPPVAEVVGELVAVLGEDVVDQEAGWMSHARVP